MTLKKNLRSLHSVSSMSLYLGSIPEILQTTVADILKHCVGGGESRAMRKKITFWCHKWRKPNINNATWKTPFVVMKYSLAINWLNYPFLDIPVCSLYRVRWNINFAFKWIWQWADDSRWLMTSPGHCDILHSKRRAKCQVQNKENPEDVCVSPMLSDFFDRTRETSHPEC